MILSNPLKSATSQALNIFFKHHKTFIGIAIIGLGILLGNLFSSPELLQLVMSLLVVFIVMLIINRNLLDGVLVWLMFMPFIEDTVNITMGAGLPDLSFSRFTISFLIVFMLAKAAIGKFRFARVGLTEVLIVGTTVGLLLSAPLSTRPTNVFQNVVSVHFTPLIVYFFAKNLVRDKADLHKILWVIAILGFVSGMYAAYEHATGNIWFPNREYQAYQLVRSSTGIRIIRGIYGSSSSIGRVLAITIPVTLYLLLERKKTDNKSFMLAGMVIAQSYGILVAMARTPWYALLIALLVMQFFYPRFRKMFIAIVIVTAVVLWATWDQIGDSDVVARVNDKGADLESRQARWDAGVEMWKEKPIQGWGFGRYRTEAGRFRIDGSNKNFANGAIENDYLHILVGSGLIGFLPYFLFLLTPLVNSLRLYHQARAPTWSGFIKSETIAVYWAVILSLLITSYTGIHVRPHAKLLAFAVAGAVVGSHEYLLRRSRRSDSRDIDVPALPVEQASSS